MANSSQIQEVELPKPAVNQLLAAVKVIFARLEACSDSFPQFEIVIMEFARHLAFPPHPIVSSVSECQWGLLALACIRVLSSHRQVMGLTLNLEDCRTKVNEWLFVHIHASIHAIISVTIIYRYQFFAHNWVPNHTLQYAGGFEWTRFHSAPPVGARRPTLGSFIDLKI